MAYFKRIEPWTAERNIVSCPDMFSFSFHLQDDCFALRGVVARLATVLSVMAHALLAPFLRMSEGEFCAQVRVLGLLSFVWGPRRKVYSMRRCVSPVFFFQIWIFAEMLWP